VRRVRILLSLLGVVLMIAATMLAGSAAMTARHPGFHEGLDPQTAGTPRFAPDLPDGRRWIARVEPFGRRW